MYSSALQSAHQDTPQSYLGAVPCAVSWWKMIVPQCVDVPFRYAIVLYVDVPFDCAVP